MLIAYEIIFWVSLAAVICVYFGYPIVLSLLSPLGRENQIDQMHFSVSLIISAFNEETVIARKLENALALDYPAEDLEIMVISDGSTDETDAIVSQYSDRGVVLRRQEPQAGKSAGLTRFVPEAHGDVVVFSDANSMYEPDALRQLVQHFADPRVGYVVGHQRYTKDSTAVSISESAYWRYETWIKQQESRLSSVVGGDGAIYAIRSELFEPLLPDDISDFTLPLKIVANGFRGIFESKAICYEHTAANFGGEFRRKARIVNRSLRAVLRVPQVLNPFRVKLFALQLLLHKVLRWFVPFFLCGTLISNIYLAMYAEEIYLWTLFMQLGFYSLALMRFVPFIGRQKPIFIAYYFCLVNLAAALGILQQLFGRSVAVWTPERTAENLALSDHPLSETTKGA